jgi:hypothetical protein
MTTTEPTAPMEPEPIPPVEPPAPPRTGWAPAKALILAAALFVVGGVGGYLIGHGGGGSSGPKTLADAFAQYRDGKLPAGDTANGGAFPGGPGPGTNGDGNGSANRQGGDGTRRAFGPGGFGGVIGTVKSNDGSTIVVETPQGDEVTVKVTGSTKVTKTVDGAASDLTAGTQIRVQVPDGSSADSKEVTAESISEVPAGEFQGRLREGGNGSGNATGNGRTSS